MSDGTALSIRGLEKSFGTTPVLAGLDLDVPVGSLTAVLGPSGSGKTSLLRLIAGFDRPDAGSIAIHGSAVAGGSRFVPPERRSLGYVPQEGALFPHLTVAANIGFGLPRARRRGGRVDELLELVGLRGFGKRMPHQLSGGEQQRVALARALAPAPELVLLDEPFSALDPALRASLRSDIEVALRAAGATALLVTHDQLEALSLADEVGVIRGGRLVQVADPPTLYREPVDPDVAQFVGDAILLPARLVDGHAECALGRLPVRGRPGRIGLATVMIRPEQLRLGPGVAGVAASVVAVDYYGHDADVRLLLDDGATALTARTAEQPLPAVGATVEVAVVGDVLAYPGNAAGPLADRAPAVTEAAASAWPAATHEEEDVAG